MSFSFLKSVELKWIEAVRNKDFGFLESHYNLTQVNDYASQN